MNVFSRMKDQILDWVSNANAVPVEDMKLYHPQKTHAEFWEI
jgi:hypothetical protein